ncbi:hypothetical protein V8C35DRAFT_334002, partial [Trichoderma chlorosporum]
VLVFLRILEYYNGILFLTTNRVGTLDEAFKSRIHMSLYFPPLDHIQVKLIFKMNLERLRNIEAERSRLTGDPELDINEESINQFVADHCNKTQVTQGAGQYIPIAGRWNGRQIRNAFQIASSLARYYSLESYGVELASNKDAKQQRPLLDRMQFEKVERATEAFKDYLEKTRGFNDADLAFVQGERDDSYGQGGFTGASSVPPSYNNPPPMAYRQNTHAQYPGNSGAAPDIQFPAMDPGQVNYGFHEPSGKPPVPHGLSGAQYQSQPNAPRNYQAQGPGSYQTFPMPASNQQYSSNYQPPVLQQQQQQQQGIIYTDESIYD